MEDNRVELREYFERIIEEHDKAHAAEHKAVKIQAKEYARRLGELNHAHERSQEERGVFVTKIERASDIDKAEVLANSVTERFEAQAASVDNRFKPLEKIASRASLLFAGSAFVGGIIGFLIQRLFAH